MFNRVNKCASEYLCNLLLHVQTMKSIPNLFENGNVVVQRPNKSFMKKNPVTFNNISVKSWRSVLFLEDNK